MQKRDEIEEALELLGMIREGTLVPDMKMPKRLKDHMAGVEQALRWVLSSSSIGALSLQQLIESARRAHQKVGEHQSLSE